MSIITGMRVQRVAYGWSQQDLAEKIKTTRPMISMIENGYKPSKRLQKELEEVFNRPFDILTKEINV